MWGRGGANIGTGKSRKHKVGTVVLSAFGSRLVRWLEVRGSNPARSAIRGCRILPGLPERGCGGKHIFLAGVLDSCWTLPKCGLLGLRGCWGKLPRSDFLANGVVLKGLAFVPPPTGLSIHLCISINN